MHLCGLSDIHTSPYVPVRVSVMGCAHTLCVGGRRSAAVPARERRQRGQICLEVAKRRWRRCAVGCGAEHAGIADASLVRI